VPGRLIGTIAAVAAVVLVAAIAAVLLVAAVAAVVLVAGTVLCRRRE
jgi:hypothetical protein